MILVFVIVLGILGWANARIGKSVLYPPALFSTLWTVLMFTLFLCGGFFDRISEETLMIYLLGAVMFSLGGLLILRFSRGIDVSHGSPTRYQQAFLRHVIDITIAVLFLAFPFYWMRLQRLSMMHGIGVEFYTGLRMQTATDVPRDQAFGMFGYLTALATFATFTSFYMDDGSRAQRTRFFTLAAITLTYHLFSAARSGAIVLIFGLIGMASLRAGRLRIKTLIIGLIVFSLVFSIPAILLKKGGSQDQSATENLASIAESALVYAISGPVAFDQVVRAPDNLGETTGLTFRFFKAAAKAFDPTVVVPSGILSFTFVPSPTNVYTMYYPYYTDFGVTGLAIIMFCLGIITTWIYKKATAYSAPFVILYGLTFGSLVTSSAGELFFTGLSFWIQAVFFTCVLCRLPFYGGRGRSSFAAALGPRSDNRLP